MIQIIGLAGGMCSGKDSWGNFLANNYGGVHVSTSNIVRNYIHENGLGEPTRDNVRVNSTELRNKNGKDYLVRTAIQGYEDNNLLIVSGLYIPEELSTIRDLGGFAVGVRASDDVRFARMKGRQRAGEILGEYNEFRRLDDNDLFGLAQTDQKLTSVFEAVDMEIDGNIPIANEVECKAIADLMFKACGYEA